MYMSPTLQFNSSRVTSPCDLTALGTRKSKYLPCVQTPPSSPLRGAPGVEESEPHPPRHHPLPHHRASELPEKGQKKCLELRGFCFCFEVISWDHPTSGWTLLAAACRPPPSSSSGPNSISSTSGTRQSSEIRQSASLADPLRPDIRRLPDDPLTVPVFCLSWYW